MLNFHTVFFHMLYIEMIALFFRMDYNNLLRRKRQ